MRDDALVDSGGKSERPLLYGDQRKLPFIQRRSGKQNCAFQRSNSIVKRHGLPTAITVDVERRVRGRLIASS
jgi:hypothetical protein